jgi:hypothetical protein
MFLALLMWQFDVGVVGFFTWKMRSPGCCRVCVCVGVCVCGCESVLGGGRRCGTTGQGVESQVFFCS